MTDPRLFNIHCDESCHLEHDGVPVMAWGAVYCQADGSRAIAEAVRALKANHGLAHDFKAKWTKVSPAKVHFYLALVDLFLDGNPFAADTCLPEDLVTSVANNDFAAAGLSACPGGGGP